MHVVASEELWRFAIRVLGSWRFATGEGTLTMPLVASQFHLTSEGADLSGSGVPRVHF